MALSAVTAQSLVNTFQSCVCGIVAAEYVVEMVSRAQLSVIFKDVYCRSSWSPGLHNQLAAKCITPMQGILMYNEQDF